MQIVIDIPEKVKQTFDNAKDENLYGNYYDYNSLIGKAIQNGTPLPKGHGRVGDLDRLYNVFEKNVVSADAFKELFDNAPTIIEADRSEEE